MSRLRDADRGPGDAPRASPIVASLSLAVDPAEAPFAASRGASASRAAAAASSSYSSSSSSSSSAASSSSPASVTRHVHVVAPGDTLGAIAELWLCDVREIRRLNDLHPDSVLYPGERLRVDTPLRLVTHVVAPGETLTRISLLHDAPLAHVRALNGLTPASTIHPGAELRVLEPPSSSPRETTTRDVAAADPSADEEDANEETKSGPPPEENDPAPADAVHDVAYDAPKRDQAAPARERERERERAAPIAEGRALEKLETLETLEPLEPFARRPPALRLALGAARLVFAGVPDVVARSLASGARGVGDVFASTRSYGASLRLPRFFSARAAAAESRRRLRATGTVTVRPGESLASVAGACGLRVRELQRVNGIVDDALDAGETLRVTRPGAFEREPRLRRRTTRRLFQIADANSGEAAERDRDAGPPPNPRGRRAERVEAAPRRWRHRGWRFEPRGEEARAYWRARSGVGRGGTREEREATRAADEDRARGRDGGMEGVGVGGSGAGARSSERSSERSGARLGPRDARALFWERRRPRRFRQHPDFGSPIAPAVDAFVTSGFGHRWGRLHAGVDLAANEGTPVLAAKGGVVRARTFDGEGYGWLLKIDHGGGWETRYAHCRRIDARVGDVVRKGQVVARVGNTGRSFGPHLHFEVRREGTPIDPLTCTKA